MVAKLLLGVLIIAIAVILMSVRVIIKHNGTFSSQHIKDNPALRRKGIGCVIDQDREERQKN